MPADATSYGNYMLKEYADGRKFYWYRSGRIAIKEYYKNGRKDGEFFEFFENGIRKSMQHYKNGILEGPFHIWNDKGVLIMDAVYRNGRYSGTTSWYYDDGSIKNRQMFNEKGQRHGADIRYYTPGQAHGIKVMYNYKDGKPDGDQTGYSLHGKIIYESTFRNGSGEYCYILNTGKKWICNSYAHGSKDGISRKFDKSGKLIAKRIYKKGKLIKEQGRWSRH